MLFFPVPVLSSLFVSFRPSLIRSHSCSSGAYLMLSLSVFPLPLRFLSSAPLPVLATQPSVFLFPSSRFPLSAVPSVLPLSLAASLPFLFRTACCHAVLPIPVLSLLRFLSPSLSRLTVATSAPRPSLAGLGLVPFAHRSRFGYSASVRSLSVTPRLPCLSATVDILPQQFSNVNNFFKKFLYILLILRFGQF